MTALVYLLNRSYIVLDGMILVNSHACLIMYADHNAFRKRMLSRCLIGLRIDRPIDRMGTIIHTTLFFLSSFPSSSCSPSLSVEASAYILPLDIRPCPIVQAYCYWLRVLVPW